LHGATKGEQFMNKRKPGNTGFEAAPLAFGGKVFGRTVDEKKEKQICQKKKYLPNTHWVKGKEILASINTRQ